MGWGRGEERGYDDSPPEIVLPQPIEFWMDQDVDLTPEKIGSGAEKDISYFRSINILVVICSRTACLKKI